MPELTTTPAWNLGCSLLGGFTVCLLYFDVGIATANTTMGLYDRVNTV